MPIQPDSKRDGSINPMEMAGLGMEIAAPIILGAWVSSIWNLGPWPVITGLFLGIVGAVAHVLVFLKRQQRAEILRRQPKHYDT